MRMLTEANDIALQICPTVPVHSKGRLHNRCGTASKKYKQAKAARKVLAQWAAAPTDAAAEEVVASTKAAHTKQMIEAHQAEHADATRLETAAALRKQLQKRIQQINREHMTHAAQIERHKQQEFADKHQKVANRMATGTYMKKNSQALKYLEDERNNNNVVAGAPCKEVIHSYIAARAAAQGPTPRQSTNQQNSNHSSHPEPFPFTLTTAADKFTLEHPPPTTLSLHHIIKDPCTFKQCTSSLSNNKCPGPDGIVNEIIKALPDDCKQAIHMLFQIMWATGITPTAWKESTTVLLYKHKGSITNLRYYRRIGLENTIYKLWTRMVTIAMTDYGERNAVHSHSQAGFRSKRSTHEQVENLVMALEDALMSKQDIYLLQVDFSEAFDTVNHDKLIQVLTALGFPQDAVRVVSDLYTGATTVVRTPYGDTDPIPIQRGTIQGDSLSPYLFILYMEPLLRWLKVGGRGYQFKAVPDLQDKVKHQMADCTYADDLNILTTSISDLARQADKLTAYADWARLTVNMDKSSATAALHCSNSDKPYDPKTVANRVVGRIHIQGTQVQLHLPKEAFRYLGIYITMDLQWRAQYQHMMQLVKKKLANLQRSWLSPKQKCEC
jgi:hypothetical protein